jgi:hypothetical protein
MSSPSSVQWTPADFPGFQWTPPDSNEVQWIPQESTTRPYLKTTILMGNFNGNVLAQKIAKKGKRPDLKALTISPLDNFFFFGQ